MSKHKDKHEEKEVNPFAKDIQTELPQEEATQSDVVENTQVQTDMTKEYEELKNQYIRLAADFDNFRKRQSQESENLLKYGAESTLKLILPVLDTYARGKKACDEMEDVVKLRENYDIIFKQLFEALEKAGLKKIETAGKEFDPNLHEAVMQTPSNEYPDNTIVDELQSGYMLADRVLRPAMVNVAVGE